MLETSKFFNSEINDNTILALHGIYDEKRVQEFIRLVEIKINGLETDLRVRKKVIHVMVEILQNVYHHAHASCNFSINSYFVLNREEKEYVLISGNFMATDEVMTLKNKLEGVNQMSELELKTEYINTLDTGTFSPKGGAGLGIMDIVRKSGNKVSYDFIQENELNTFFMLKVKVTG